MPKKKNPDKLIIKKAREFDLFARWMTLPPMFRGQNVEFLEKMGFEDELYLQLLNIPTITEFARVFNVDRGTLQFWRERKEFWDLVDKYKKEIWKNKTPNVLAALYKKILQEGDAARIRLWLEYIEDWKTKTEIELQSKQLLIDLTEPAIEKIKEEKNIKQENNGQN